MEAISLSRKERSRLEVMSRVRDGQMTVSEAAAMLGLSYQQLVPRHVSIDG